MSACPSFLLTCTQDLKDKSSGSMSSQEQDVKQCMQTSFLPLWLQPCRKSARTWKCWFLENIWRGEFDYYLHAGYNNLTGSIADTVPAGSNLQVFHVQNNSLTGKMPASLSNANYLSDLNTSCNMMTGTLPASVGYIRTLSSFVIAVNNHTGVSSISK